MAANLTFDIDSRLYLRKPEETELGRKIIAESIELMEEIGFDQFTFRKLAQHIDSTEASIYRYFSSKHQLLQFLIAWYWNWVHHGLELRINNITDKKKRLKIVLGFIAEAMENDPTTFLNEGNLHLVVTREAGKLEALSKLDQTEFLEETSEFNLVINLLASVIKENFPNNSLTKTLALTSITLIHRLHFYASVAPRLTELGGKGKQKTTVVEYVEKIISKTSQ